MQTSELGLRHMLENADAVIWLTAIVLLVMSIMSWTLIIAKGRASQKLRRTAAETAALFWQGKSLEDGAQLIRGHEAVPLFEPLARVALELENDPPNDRLDGQASLEDRITRQLRRALHAANASLEGGLVTLASIGATAPFVGLFGTVWSIYQALINISGSGQIMIEQVAGPVGEALIMTAFGLFVAIPAVLGYNALSKSNRIAMQELDGFANDLRAYLLQKRG